MYGVYVTRKAVDLGDIKEQKVPFLLKVAGQKKFIDILQSSYFLLSSYLDKQLITTQFVLLLSQKSCCCLVCTYYRYGNSHSKNLKLTTYSLHNLQLQSKSKFLIFPLQLFSVQDSFMQDAIARRILDPRKRALSISYPVVFSFLVS